jgi:hypothetical protein
MVKVFAAAAVLTAAAAFVQPAAATEPTRADFTASGTVTLAAGTLCSFPIVLTGAQEWTTTTFFDGGGVITSRITTGTEQDTFSANDKTLVGDQYHFNFISRFEDGVRVTRYSEALAEQVHLPDGGVFVIAGRVLAVSDEPVLSVDAGNSGNNLAAFCSALS